MKPYFKVLRVDHGREPVVKHATLKEAETEALRLAGQHPGETFEILQVLGIARTTEPAIFWNDEVEPPIEKPSYRMLELGEIIADGDEYQEYNGQWYPWFYSVNAPVSESTPLTRRPIANTSKP